MLLYPFTFLPFYFFTLLPFLPFYLFTFLPFQIFFYIFQYSVERGGGLVTIVFL